MFDLPCPTSTYSPVKQPSIFIGSFEFTEPIMVFTDLLVAAICFYAFFRLGRVARSSRVRLLLRTYFLGMGLATTIGGVVGHGLMRYVSLEYKLPGWLLSMIAIAVLERACIQIAKPYISKRTGTFFSVLNVVELLLFITISFTTLCFFYVEVHSAYGLLIVVSGFSLFTYLKTRKRGSLLFLIGVGVACLAAAVYSFEVSFSVWFTHIDFGHILMAITTLFFYRGSVSLLTEDNVKKTQSYTG